MRGRLASWLTAAQWDAPVSLATVRPDRHTALPRAYGLAPLALEASRAGTWVGDRTQGSSVNCDDAYLCIHSAGTHTECAAHVSDLSVRIDEVAPLTMLRAAVVTVEPTPDPAEACWVSDARFARAFDDALARARLLSPPDAPPLDAVVLRTLIDTTPLRDWSGTAPPYLDPRLVERLVRAGILHLIVDLPSVDPEVDGGALIAHRTFFGIDLDPLRATNATITELAWIPDHVADGLALLRLDVVAWPSDAAPSRPVMYPLDSPETASSTPARVSPVSGPQEPQ